jgi:signal transduction histidine kinase
VLRIDFKNWRSYLVPRIEADDPDFKSEVVRLSRNGLRVIAAVSIGAPLFVYLLGWTWVPEMLAPGGAYCAPCLFMPAAIMVVGLVVLGLSFVGPLQALARTMGIATGYTIAIIQIGGTLSLMPEIDASHQVPGHFTLVMLVGIAALPLKPLQILALGAAVIVSHPVLVRLLGLSDQLGGMASVHSVDMVTVTLISVGLTAVLYHQRASAHRARCDVERSFEELRRAQADLLVSRNAASQGRFAAALSHDLNSPLAALTSSFDVIVRLEKRHPASPEDRERLDRVLSDAAHSGREACQRIRQTIERLKLLTNLDRADEQVVDLNRICQDTVVLLRADLEHKARIELDLAPLPPIKCRPQHISAVVAHLIRNAGAAIADKGEIRLRSASGARELFLEIEDNGRGIPAERLPGLFEPSFDVTGTRVATTNWGLFVSRSIIADHGGQIGIESTEGRGTKVRIVLPVIPAAA